MSLAESCGGVVLCGGRSSRMGLAKANLPFGPERLLQRVVGILGQVVSPIVVVAAADQQLPPLPEEVLLCRDEREGQGPLEGMYVGLRALGDLAEAAYVTSSDVPFLQPAFVRHLIANLGDAEIAVPFDDQHHHPLAAIYRCALAPTIQQLLEADRRRPFFLFEEVRTHRIPTRDLAVVDPQLRTLTNLNRPEDYLAALLAANFTAPPEIIAKLNK